MSQHGSSHSAFPGSHGLPYGLRLPLLHRWLLWHAREDLPSGERLLRGVRFEGGEGADYRVKDQNNGHEDGEQRATVQAVHLGSLGIPAPVHCVVWGGWMQLTSGILEARILARSAIEKNHPSSVHEEHNETHHGADAIAARTAAIKETNALEEALVVSGDPVADGYQHTQWTTGGNEQRQDCAEYASAPVAAAAAATIPRPRIVTLWRWFVGAPSICRILHHALLNHLQDCIDQAENDRTCVGAQETFGRLCLSCILHSNAKYVCHGPCAALAWGLP
mmetsp:Transcript_7364/g.16799  ORF Transcript_7364/g.16799 Transcript_7364/m.16799 type:complete len:278 (+) Transcript_7364:128-961(+)